MQNVIVSVKLQGDVKEYDLEVPVDVPSQKLAELITHNIDPNASTKGALTVRCLKPGPARLLLPDVSLAGSGLWDGILLEISPESAISDPTWEGILLGWDPLRTDEPARRSSSTSRGPRPDKSEPPVAKPMPPSHAPPSSTPLPTPLDDLEWLPLMNEEPSNGETPDDVGTSGWKKI